jgi:DNA repair exonuclease SbcCD nuclease subunit
MTTVLFIGDPHIQVSNIPEVDLFMEKIINLATDKNPDIIIIAGDLLHTHERLHTIALNKAYELVNNMRLISKTYVLVGNHDYIQNQQFLTENHWMNVLKEWNNTIIVDKVIKENIKGEEFVFVPYVPPGRFEDALNTLNEEWKDVSCIFAHQEFFGCKMGAIVSVEGDKWSLDYPSVISGHIHSKQSPQKNIYYSGSAMQHAFGESEKNIIAFLTFKNKIYENEEIDLKLPRKKIIYMGIENIDDFKIPDTEDKLKVTLKGNYEDFKSVKKTKKYKELLEKNIKVVFKPDKKESVINETNIANKDDSFNNILNNIINKEKDSYLLQVYELIINNKKINHSDIIFL